MCTTHGFAVDVIDPGLLNRNSGPDFFNAKVRIDGMLWVGNVEIHDRASDWNRHSHRFDSAYSNVILHVVGKADTEVEDCNGKVLPCIELPVPKNVVENYERLLEEDKYPPCFHIIPSLPQLTIHAWLSALQTERLVQKSDRIASFLKRLGGDWETVCFITLARNFGFGVNGDAFEEWGLHIPLMSAGKHRDNAFQIEALFFGQAGLLNSEMVPEVYREESARDGYREELEREYKFLAHKFSLQPMDASHWRFMRMRPQNFPHIRLAQLTDLYLRGSASMSQLIESDDIDVLRDKLRAKVTPYWENHYVFGSTSAPHPKTLQERSLNLILINTVAPLLFAYGRYRGDDKLCHRAYTLLESLPAEDNRIVRSWAAIGVKVDIASDSQALIQLNSNYCERKDCLRCRFGYEYLSHPRKGKYE